MRPSNCFAPPCLQPLQFVRISHPRCRAVLADPTQIHQILMNLCTNAAHAMRENGGVLAVTLRIVGDDSGDGAGSLGPESRPLCEAHGCATPEPASNRKVSTASSIPSSPPRKRAKGTGLGLSVVYGIVSSCGGTITVQSEPGPGSVFSVYLPAVDEDAETEAGTLEADPARATSGCSLSTMKRCWSKWAEMMLEGLGLPGHRRRQTAPEALDIFRTSRTGSIW